jgi:hypothetical protein
MRSSIPLVTQNLVAGMRQSVQKSTIAITPVLINTEVIAKPAVVDFWALSRIAAAKF